MDHLRAMKILQIVNVVVILGLVPTLFLSTVYGTNESSYKYGFFLVRTDLSSYIYHVPWSGQILYATVLCHAPWSVGRGGQIHSVLPRPWTKYSYKTSTYLYSNRQRNNKELFSRHVESTCFVLLTLCL